MKRGSVTVFSALCMMLVASLLFTLLEAARVYGLDSYAGMKTDAGVESACAEYQPLLWQDYGLLLLDGSYATGTFSIENVTEKIRTNLETDLSREGGLADRWRFSAFRLNADEVTALGYQMVTDDNGEVFLNLIAECMKETLPLELAEEIYNFYKEEKSIEDSGGDVSESIDEAERLLEEERKKAAAEKEGDETDSPKQQASAAQNMGSVKENPLELVKTVKQSPLLDLVAEDATAISSKAIGLEDTLEKREKEKGNLQTDEQADWYRKILALAYLDKYYSCYTEKQEDHFLEYEMEYVLCGKSTEKENLEGVVERLLLIREAANVTYLLTDRDKMDLAEALAMVIGALAEENEAVVKAVKIAIIGAWAFLESVLDVRSLLAGEKIPLVKEKEQWTTDVENLKESFQENAKAKKCESGFTYTDYLKQMIFFMGNEKLAYRMMEVMECNLRNNEAYKNCRMDHMIVRLHYQISYQANPLFYKLSLLGDKYSGKFYFSKEREFSYVP